MPIIVPPGGFAGFAQQTPATQNLFQRAGRLGGRTTQRRRRKKNGGGRTLASLTGDRKRFKGKRKFLPGDFKGGKFPARMKKGSPAAKNHMAKLRKMRRRK